MFIKLEKRAQTPEAAGTITPTTIGELTVSGMTTLEEILTQGGDDRSLLDKDGFNKYHIAPVVLGDDAVFRGSCTCNAPTKRGYNAAQELFHKLESADSMQQAVAQMIAQQRSRIVDALSLPEGTEVILCPSGSDAEYFPLLIAMALKEDSQGIINILSQNKETGSGTAQAGRGEYFSKVAPLLEEKELADRVASFGSHLDGLSSIQSININARDGDGNSKITNEELKSQKFDEKAFRIYHSVYGGKTGLQDDIILTQDDMDDDTYKGPFLPVIDACQGRFDFDSTGPSELHKWLDSGAVVLFRSRVKMGEDFKFLIRK